MQFVGRIVPWFGFDKRGHVEAFFVLCCCFFCQFPGVLLCEEDREKEQREKKRERKCLFYSKITKTHFSFGTSGCTIVQNRGESRRRGGIAPSFNVAR